MDDFGAPGGQVQIYSNSIKFSLKMDDFGAPGGQIQILVKFN